MTFLPSTMSVSRQWQVAGMYDLPTHAAGSTIEFATRPEDLGRRPPGGFAAVNAGRWPRRPTARDRRVAEAVPPSSIPISPCAPRTR